MAQTAWNIQVENGEIRFILSTQKNYYREATKRWLCLNPREYFLSLYFFLLLLLLIFNESHPTVR